jgi:hypothetical protein
VFVFSYLLVLAPLPYYFAERDASKRLRVRIITIATMGFIACGCFVFGAVVIIRAVYLRAKQVCRQRIDKCTTFYKRAM